MVVVWVIFSLWTVLITWMAIDIIRTDVNMAQWSAPKCPHTPREDGDHEWETDVVDVNLPGGGTERIITVLCRYCGKQKGKPRKERNP